MTLGMVSSILPLSMESDKITKTKRNKQFKKERERCNPDHRCLKCGGKINGSHHFFCNRCYLPGLMYAGDFRKILKEKQMEKMNNE